MTTTLTRRTLLAAGSAAAGLGLLPRLAQAAGDFPSREITYIIPYNAGGMSDNISRIIGERLTAITGQTVINEYKAGAGGALGGNFFMGTKPDGYTVLQSTNSFYSVIPLSSKVDFDPNTDFVPLCVFGFAPMVIAANPSTGATSLAELVEVAKSRGEPLAYGTAGKGTVGNLCGRWLANRTGIELLHVPYKGATEALQACLSDEVQLFFGPESIEPIKAGSLNGIAVIGDNRAVLLPDLPTTAEAGVTGWAPRSWHTLTLLSTVPEDIRATWWSLLDGILSEPEVQERIRTLGLYPARYSLEQVRELANEDYQQIGEMLRSIG